MAWHDATPTCAGVAQTCTLRWVTPDCDGAASAVAPRPLVAAAVVAAAARTRRRFTEPPSGGRFGDHVGGALPGPSPVRSEDVTKGGTNRTWTGHGPDMRKPQNALEAFRGRRPGD